MALTVYTARLSYRGEDRLDISRYGGHALGVAFAPSLELLYWMKRGLKTPSRFEEYRAKYKAEMRASYASRRASWNELLGYSQVTLCCFCQNRASCHRGILAGILVSLGATDEGERE